MKLSQLRFVALGLLLAVSLSAGSRETAFQARAMLGPDIWSRVLRIENARAGRHSRYPAEFHALVVAFQGILWFYTEFDGTQNLSLYAGRLEQDRADLGPLLRAIEPGLKRFEDVTDHRPDSILAASRPPRACFLASIAHWQQLQRESSPPSRARLLAYYLPAGRQGHMVLEYWREGRRYVFDPERPADERELPVRLTEDPLTVARALFSPWDREVPARVSPLELDVPDPTLAAWGSASSRSGATTAAQDSPTHGTRPDEPKSS